MAKKTPAAPRFFEVVFRGKPKVVKAFLKGLMMGAGREVTVYFNFDEGVHHEGKTEKFKEMFGIRAIDCHVITDSDGSKYMKKMAGRIAAETGLEITAHRAIRSASMAFTYQAFAPRYSAEIVAMLKKRPKGLRLQGYEHQERRDPSAKGVEAYSVAHDFEATGSGTISGRIDLLIELKRTFADYPLIKANDIILKLA
jgi:hypothetical protein